MPLASTGEEREKDDSVAVWDKESLQLKLARMERRSTELRAALNLAAEKGIDISYPQTSWALSKLFERLIKAELGTEKREYAKLNWQMDYVFVSMQKSRISIYCVCPGTFQSAIHSKY